nr:hypothetical protein Iba_chr12cCG19050 [Ipomoea batatas]
MTFWEYSFRYFALGYSDRFGFSNEKYLWFEASPYNGSGYKKGLAEGGHKETGHNKKTMHKRLLCGS